MENLKMDYQYEYDYNRDILLKSKDGGRKWSYLMDEDGEPVYSEVEKQILLREREIWKEAQERWEQEQMEMMEDPEYWENYYHQYEDYMSDDENEIISDLANCKSNVINLNEKREEKEKAKLNLPETVTEKMEFPIDALPYGVKDIVKAGHEAFDVGHEFFALPSLVACATAIGSKFEVAINDTMTTKPILYACLIAMPGSGKSPAQKTAMKPLKTMQKQAMESYVKEMKQYNYDIRDYESKEKQAKRDSVEFNDEQPKKPKLQEYYTTNSTIEAIAKILERSPKGIAFINDEFLGFYNSLNSYKSGKGSDLQEWLSLWNGNEMKIDRKSDDIPLIVNDPYVSIVGNMTPSGIKQIAGDSNTENGFLDRFLFSFPTDNKPFNPAKENGISTEIEEQYFNLIKDLIEMESNKDNKYIRLSDDALNTYREYFKMTNEIAGDDEKLRSIVAKLQMYSVRFGLIIHLCEQQNSEGGFKHLTIQKSSMEKAIQLCEYFRLQADKIYEKLATSESDELYERVLKVIKKKATSEGEVHIISKRDIQRATKLKADQLNGILDDLLAQEIIKVKEEGKRGSITYYVDLKIIQ